jgi:beta-glucanase (GH16 family)
MARPFRVHARVLPFIAACFALACFALLLVIVPGRPGDADAVWRLSFSDNFSGNQIDGSSWAVYGKNGPKGPHCWYDKNVTVGGGMATLKVLPDDECDGYSAAGMCACPVATQSYGKFEVRMKATVGNSKITFLLWGASQWPPEIDFAEFPADGDGMQRQRYNQTLHYSSDNKMIHDYNEADMTVWHTVGVEWSPGLISYTLDGTVTDTVTDHVPSVKMWLGLQTDGSSDSTPAFTYLDWVRVYTYTG